MPKVSIIVAVYNAQEFLPACLDSLINQTVRDIEIICVNDCSEDDSGEILAKYAERDDRIQLIEFSENLGPGPARNAGLDAARGDFVRLVDSDDFIPENSTEVLLDIAGKYNSDFVRGGCWFCDISGNRTAKGWRYPEELVINTSSRNDRRLWHFDQHWAWLLSRRILSDNGIRYDESMRNGQDSAFMIDLLPYMNRASIVSETVYYYRHHSQSIMRRKRSKEFYFNVLGLYDRAFSVHSNVGMREVADYYIYVAFCAYIPNNILASLPNSLVHEERLEVLNYLKQIVNRYDIVYLCFNKRYSWKTNRAIPLYVKQFIILIASNYVEDAYQTLITEKTRSDRDKLTIQDLEDCRYMLQCVYDSTSWKVTQPLRKISKKVRKY